VAGVFVFQIVQGFVAIVFAFFISDFRKKKNMVPLIKERWTLILKISCLFPIVAYAYVLFTLQRISTLDLFALSLTSVGMFLVLKAKSDLAKHHTWAGYCLSSARLFAKGIYAYIRHPLYTGIYLFIFGFLLTVVPHGNWQLTLIAGVPLIYIMTFLAYSASKETEMLKKNIGNKFLAYKSQVHFCLPLRKYVEVVSA